MTHSKLIIRTKKNRFFKSKKYRVKVDNLEVREINYENTKAAFDVLPGKHLVEVQNGTTSQQVELSLVENEQKTVQINPTVTYELFFGFLLGMALVTIVIMILIYEEINLPLMLVPLLPLLLVRRKSFPDHFTLTVYFSRKRS